MCFTASSRAPSCLRTWLGYCGKFITWRRASTTWATMLFCQLQPRCIIPHSRGRIYMIGHRDVCNAGVAFRRVVMESISQMEDLIIEPLEIDQYLLSEIHPVVTARRAHFQERLSVNKCRSAMQPRQRNPHKELPMPHFGATTWPQCIQRQLCFQSGNSVSWQILGWAFLTQRHW